MNLTDAMSYGGLFALLLVFIGFAGIFAGMHPGHRPRRKTGEPEAGARVSVVLDGAVRRAVVMDPFDYPCDEHDHFGADMVRKLAMDIGTTRYQLAVDDEGWLWCRGWDRADGTALLAAWALRRVA